MKHSSGGKNNRGSLVGSEIPHEELLKRLDVTPLLKGIIKAGAGSAGIADARGQLLKIEGNQSGLKVIPSPILQEISKGQTEGRDWQSSTLYHEGESIGFLFVVSPGSTIEKLPSGLMELAVSSIKISLRNSARYTLTTELHNTVVQASYHELLETNNRLSASEKKYRELSEDLERKVEERTEALKKVSTRMLQQEKMASIGQLAAGMAHEINNPLGFIISNLQSLSDYTDRLKEIFKSDRLPPEDLREQNQALETSRSIHELDTLWKDINDTIGESIQGAKRIHEIVVNLKGFSHIDEINVGQVDINVELDKTLSVLSNEINSRSAEIIKRYGKIPVMPGNPGLLCQAFLNIFVNALSSKEKHILIKVTTEQKQGDIIISIQDNGKGIPPDIQNRIFDPFFTTKDVGQGTGMGLTVANDIVVSHGGTLSVKSETGKGSNFIITLPLTGTEDVKVR